MLLVLFNSIVIGLVAVTIIQAYEIKNLKNDIHQIKLVQVVTTLKDNKIDFSSLKETLENKIKEGVKDENISVH